MTAQGIPQGVQPPMVTALSPSSLHVSWSEPHQPNGVIKRYHLNQTGVGVIVTLTGGPRNYTVTGEICHFTNVQMCFHIPKLSVFDFCLPIQFFTHKKQAQQAEKHIRREEVHTKSDAYCTHCTIQAVWRLIKDSGVKQLHKQKHKRGRV